MKVRTKMTLHHYIRLTLIIRSTRSSWDWSPSWSPISFFYAGVIVHFCSYYLQELMEDINLQTLRGIWFQHDGAPVHCASVVRNYSNERFSQRWIGRKTNIFSFLNFLKNYGFSWKTCLTILMQNFMFFQNMQWKILHSI